METTPWPTQKVSEIVQVSEWDEHEDPEVLPVGSKPKKMLICPDNPPQNFLIPGHRYMFKTVPGWREQQVWSEIIAYELSKLCGIEVPPSFAAFNAVTGEVGVLMEFFYGYPDEPQPVRLVPGTDIIQRLDRKYDTKLGRPHCVPMIIGACRAYKVSNPREWWAKTLAFDVLIGNTDRHAENWGLLRGASNIVGKPEWKLAPAFDNGTSLGYEVREEGLLKQLEPAAIARRIARGRHHCTWNQSMARQGDHFFALCRQLCEAYPSLRNVMDRTIPTSDAPIGEIVSRWTEFDLPVKFSAARADFVERLIRARRNALVEAIGL